MDKVRKGISEAAIRLSPSGGHLAAQAILTTDLVTKEVAVEFKVGRAKIRIGGMAKGSGMIHPQMATMLAFITTDAKISRSLLQKLLQGAVEESFHRITVDKDQSTNDTVLVLANGASDVEIGPNTTASKLFHEGLSAVCVTLAKMIARDGEGATRLMEIHVTGARDVASAAKIARQIAGSDLVKTAVHGGDPNVGRILGAAGAAGIAIDSKKLRLWVGPVLVAARGQIEWKGESSARKEMRKDPVTFRLDLGLGRAEATAWGCDLSKEYVKINADYRT
jgi:glutamate N-acetyltransferase/amino-acid N-acetyltransferase